MKVLLFNRWETEGIEVSDPGLKRYINLKPFIVPKTSGRLSPTSIHKVDMSIVERFMNKLAVPGHKGKKHKLTSGHVSGRYDLLYRSVKEAFEIVEKRTKKNPLQILVRAVENGALLEEVVGYRMGGIIARKAVVTSPQRRLDVSLRLISQNIFSRSFKSRKSFAETIAEELINIANNDQRNNVIRERQRAEKEAEGAR
ncbi:MAG: 30S ribosomal protein S7 [Candidatus Aenigmarchaeota archaeon]|nr:30S ribosomal protein S7 [Candidatus Aenigmarchaeota archaeon]NIP41008.1 30S ribosomal protein S7 [Candidatus Aenigmarchaeota archaeon]NIQ17410.1 30S ribosomal protein S7 [Candidatus Aenigmarchaeota archaeon]NIS73604.1 30S ribosomal protein S7 [Candidatus Aenigmarchaeota archaeon]